MIHRAAVRDDWLDGLGHMNMRYYLHAFTDAADAGFERFFYSPEALAGRRSAVTAELHLTYLADAKAREPFAVTTWIASVGEKKLQLYQEMRSLQRQALLAAAEQLWLFVDLGQSKAIPFESGMRQELLALQRAASPIPVPNCMGRAIGATAQKPARRP